MIAREKQIQSRVTLLMGVTMALILVLIVLFPALGQADEVVRIVSPMDGATVSGLVDVSVQVTDASDVQLFVSTVGGALVNEGAAVLTQDDTWVARWDTRIYENGPYTLTIKALNQVNNALPTATVSVLVDNEAAENVTPDGDPSEEPSDLDTDSAGNSASLLELELLPLPEDETRAIDLTELAAYSVDEALTIDSIAIDTQSSKENHALTFSGKALPETTLALHIFSEPIVVTVQTDEHGDWVYTLNAGLEEGRHEVYLTITDTTAEKSSRSNVLSFFVPRVYAAHNLPSAPAAQATTITSSDDSLSTYLFVSIGLILGAIGTLLAVKLLGNTQPKARS